MRLGSTTTAPATGSPQGGSTPPQRVNNITGSQKDRETIKLTAEATKYGRTLKRLNTARSRQI